MGNIKIQRLSRRIKEIVSQVVLYELQDPRVGLVTFTRVKLSPDLRHADVFYSALGDEADLRTLRRALEHSKGHIQSELAARLETRNTPLLKFHFDQGIKEAIRLEEVFREMREEVEEIEGKQGETSEPEIEGDSSEDEV